MNLSNLSLAFKAGKVITGEDIVLEGIRKGKVFLVFVSNDSSMNTLKKFKDKTSFYNVGINLDYSTSELSLAIGKENRHILGITDRGFAKLLQK